MRKTWLAALAVLLGGCSVDRAATPETRIVEKLRSCDVLGEGQFSVAFQPETDACELRCFDAARCAELHDAFCADSAGERSDYLKCLDRCGVGGPIACEDGSNDEAIRCDAFPECADGSDELDCDDAAFFFCEDEGRVPIDFRCDGENDCFDASDEQGCPPDAFYTCDAGEQIPTLWRCDGMNDCKDNLDASGNEIEEHASDERDCPADAFFACVSGERVPTAWVCDGAPDCADGSDEEQDCAPLQCVPASALQ